jgi:ankyrin repeat protein
VPAGRLHLIARSNTRDNGVPAFDPGLIPLFIKRGADVNAKYEFGATPLHEAASTENVAVVEQLLANGADLGAIDDSGLTALHWAKHPFTTRLLLSAGADPTVLDKIGKAPEHYAFDFEVYDILRGARELAELERFSVSGNPQAARPRI